MSFLSRLDAIIARKMELEPPPVETVAICGALLKAHLAVNATTERLTKEFVGRNAAPPPDLLTSLVELKVDFICNHNSRLSCVTWPTHASRPAPPPHISSGRLHLEPDVLRVRHLPP